MLLSSKDPLLLRGRTETLEWMVLEEADFSIVAWCRCVTWCADAWGLPLDHAVTTWRKLLWWLLFLCKFNFPCCFFCLGFLLVLRNGTRGIWGSRKMWWQKKLNRVRKNVIKRSYVQFRRFGLVSRNLVNHVRKYCLSV